jgi:hypothetical protein
VLASKAKDHAARSQVHMRCRVEHLQPWERMRSLFVHPSYERMGVMGYMLDVDEMSETTLMGELISRLIRQRAGYCDYCNHPVDSSWEVDRSVTLYGVTIKVPHSVSSCKEYERHRGEGKALPEMRHRLLELLKEAVPSSFAGF